jgi:cell division initiation protein
MLTPQEVSEHGFSKASFGGYNMAMVDEFLDQLTEDYTALYKENASLKAKMKVLADSLEEYRATEKGMRRALLAAQQAADEMVKEAESRKGELIRDAEADAQARIAQLRRQINDEEARLSAAQTATAEYVAQVREACRKQEASLDKLDSISAPAASSSSVEQTAQAIEQSVQRLIEEEEEEAAPQQDAAEPVQEESGEEPSLYEEVTRSRRDQERERSFEAAPQAQGMDTTSPTRRIDFDNLQFGSNYDLK